MKANTYRSKKAKGKKLEKKVARRIRQVLGDDKAQNMPGSGVFNGFKGDIFTSLPTSWECKNQEKIQIWKCWQQSKDQATEGEMPILCIDRNYNKDILSVLKFEDLLKLMSYAIKGGWCSFIEKNYR